MLKLYTNTDFLTETYRRQVFPLLFDLVFKENKILLSKYSLIDSVEASDIIVFPVDYAVFFKHKKEMTLLLNLAKEHQKPIWIYTAGDYGFTNYIPNSYTFRLGGFDSQLDDNTFVIPSFINDPYDSFLSQGFSVLKKEAKPSIGFVGHAQSGFKKYLKEYTNHLKYRIKRAFNLILEDKQSFYPSSVKRAKYLTQLVLNDHLDTQFILRNKYRAGAHLELTQKDSAQEFYNNIFNTAYTFCIRGVGNFSVRLYETLAVGRLPILLNTDCRLPLSSKIDWSKHCLIIDEKSKIPIAEQIEVFHNNVSEIDFEKLQITNRDLWLNTLRREPYFLEIYNQFKTKQQ